MGEKNVNYTAEMEAEMQERYEACESEADRKACVEALSADLGKPVRSIRAKLVRMGIYVAQAKAPAGKRAATKESIVADSARALGVSSEQLPGLEKAGKPSLALIAGTLRAARAALDAKEDAS